MPDVQFNATRGELKIISQIVKRVNKYLAAASLEPLDPLTATMDLDAVHSNGCPMDFQRLLEADDFNMLHDLGGIRRHLDRSTGKLADHFRPRFAAKD